MLASGYRIILMMCSALFPDGCFVRLSDVPGCEESIGTAHHGRMACSVSLPFLCNILCRHAQPREHDGKDRDNHFAYYPDELRFMDFLVSNFPVRDVRLFGGNVPGLREEDPVEGWGVCEVRPVCCLPGSSHGSSVCCLLIIRIL